MVVIHSSPRMLAQRQQIATLTEANAATKTAIVQRETEAVAIINGVTH
jgi:hypothetical protein